MLVLHKEPDPILKEVCQPIKEFTPQSKRFLTKFTDEMAKVMYHGRGVGIAAPQVGFLHQVILVDPSGGKSLNSLRVMINPEIKRMSNEKIIEREGCLSLPSMLVPVERSLHILIEYQDLNGNEHSVELDGYEARIAQHETDHLYGITLSSFIKRG